MSAAPILQAHDIALGYAQPKAEFNLVLQDFSLDLAHGELVALLGPSGVGKSSLLRVLAGLDQPHRGQVQIFGQTISRPHARAAFVFQQPSLLPWLTAPLLLGKGFKLPDTFGNLLSTQAFTAWNGSGGFDSARSFSGRWCRLRYRCLRWCYWGDARL